MSFVKTPNLPSREVCAVIAAPCRPLQNSGVKIIIPTYPLTTLPPPLNLHADLQLHHLGGGDILCAPECFSYYKKELSPLGFNVMKGNISPSGNYPSDAAYNIARLGGTAIHNTKHTDPGAALWYFKKRLRMLYVSQGYAKCAVCVLKSDAIITADAGIARAAEGEGIKTLLISPGYISLPGFNYGFIGGATGLLSPETLAITGSLRRHPDRDGIYAFLAALSVRPLELGQDEPIDIGSLIPILERARQ